MDHSDFWTSIIAAGIVFTLAFPSMLPSPPGVPDPYGAFRLLLMVGPLAMVTLALIERRRTAGERGDLDRPLEFEE